ncbi:MAG: M1 family metallopeptidase [Chitinophagales bacterium]|nr:M1 family metallopeptidase [Chitinophagales bacterium]
MDRFCTTLQKNVFAKHYLLIVTCWLLFLHLTFSFKIYAQTGEYRSPSNPLYWKNKLPKPGYWQQDVHYKIKATIDESTDIIHGEEILIYYNNSPDTLKELFFHLYQNAFQPGSYLHQLQVANGVKPVYGKYESARLGIVIQKIAELNTKKRTKENHDFYKPLAFYPFGNLKAELDNTILKVIPSQPIPPNDSAVLLIQFKTFFDTGSTRRRMKKFKAWGYTHYNGCQWYPKICVYDAHSGWNTDQHLNREFYGDFGTFEVELTFADNYIVEATGTLLNEDEVLPDSLKAKIHIRNFKDKPWGEKPSEILPYSKGKTKTWKYRAINVHDFAFTANPAYRMADTTIELQGGHCVRCVALAQEPHCSGWQNAHEYCAKIISVFSRDFGRYEYPKMVVADAADGMEYPMITLDGGRDPEYRGLLVHEVGHNWFYGMLGNNETYRPMLDEGFTQFITAWGLEKIDNTDTIIYEWDKIKNKYLRFFTKPQNIRDSRVFLGYLYDAIQYNDEPINTHSDYFHGALGQGGGYRHVYMKTATMLYNLQYVLGDSLFLEAMKHYVNTWKIAHPYPEDFRNSIIRYVKTDLNWFFDQWMETTKNIDYRISKIKKGTLKEAYRIYFRRKGRMHMPLDIRVIARNNRIYNFYIPNNWFIKPEAISDTTVTILPRWIGWDKLQPVYIAEVQIPSGIKNIIIDPSNRLADINMMDNSWRRKVELLFDSRIFPPASRTHYRMWMRPDIWWNAYDGIKAGVHIHGNYLNTKHVFALTLWWNTKLLQGGNEYFPEQDKNKAALFSFRFDYRNAIDRLIKHTSIYVAARWLDGLQLYRAGVQKNFQNNVAVDLNVKAFNRPRRVWRNYLVYPQEWSTFGDEGNALNASVNLSANWSYQRAKNSGSVRLMLRSATLFNRFDYHYIEAEHKNNINFRIVEFRHRLFGRIGTGSSMPRESALYFAGANAEDFMENKYVRAAGFVPPTWAKAYGERIGHFHYGGGLNLRGYSGYLIPERDDAGNISLAYRGNSGWSLNTELDFTPLFRFKKNKLAEWVGLNPYLFADAGMIVYENSLREKQLSQLRADAGAGIALTIRKWSVLQGIKPLTIRFDVPFYVSHAPAEEQNLAWRFLIGINRAF